MNNIEFITAKSSSAYSKPEDRVTAEFLKILHYGGHELVKYLFGDFDLPDNSVNVILQDYSNKVSRPDGRISCDCKYDILVESKITKNALNTLHGQQQLAEHLKYAASINAFILYLTPDDTCPPQLSNITNLVWMNWKDVLQRLKDYDSKDRLLDYLISEFTLTIEQVVYKNVNVSRVPYLKDVETTIDDGKDERVIIVGGRWGEPVALKYNVYICRANRFFYPAKYLAFCYDNRINYLFEIVKDPIDSISLDKVPEITATDYLTAMEPSYNPSEMRKVFLLKLVKDDLFIQNDSKDKNGKTCAFTQKQRYTTYNKIMSAKVTSELV